MRATSARLIVPALAGLVRPPFVLLLALLLTSCGRADAPVPETGPQGPPRWRVQEAGTGLLLHCRSALRARLRVEATGSSSEPGPWRDLATGQTVGVDWTFSRLSKTALQDKAPQKAVAAGRTEIVGMRLDYSFKAWPATQRRDVLWARPGRGRIVHKSVLPPGRYEDLTSEGTVELVTVALTDFAEGTIRLKRRNLETRVLLPEPVGAEDRHQLVRLFLDIAPAKSP